MNPLERTVVFAGSFNPFTIGHADIVERALKMAGRVVIAIGYNRDKGAPDDLETRLKAIQALYTDNPRIEVLTYSGSTADFAKGLGAVALVRGIRDTRDFEYERSLADANMKIGGIDTWFLTCKPELGYISSSLVRELQSLGKDVTGLLPQKENNK